jgi:hypothetical protein
MQEKLNDSLKESLLAEYGLQRQQSSQSKKASSPYDVSPLLPGQSSGLSGHLTTEHLSELERLDKN